MDDVFGSAHPVTAFNTGEMEQPSFISRDRRSFYFSRSGSGRLFYVATKSS